MQLRRDSAYCGSRLLWGLSIAVSSVTVRLAAAQQFEIPMDMFQQMMGGGGGGGGRPATEWPKTVNSEIVPEFEWLVNTEWAGKTAKYLLLRGGIVESPLKECEHEGMCLWAANEGQVMLNTPTLKVMTFTVGGLDQADTKKLKQKDTAELQKLKLVSIKASKSGKRSELKFERLATSDEDNVPTQDLFKLLDVTEDAEDSAIKSKFRKLSVKHHPDKGGDPQVFNQLREAYEILSDKELRRYYTLGGVQLVKNVQALQQQVEGQKAELDAKLAQVPKNHPQYRMYEAQIEQQKAQMGNANQIRHDVEKKLKSETIEVFVPVSSQELYNGIQKKDFQFSRLVICRGCRADPDSPECKDCGRCPPEKVQVPKYANTPFGKQVVGVREKERESSERCREVPVLTEVKIPKGAKQGMSLGFAKDQGHQTPGKIPGAVELKVQRGSPDDKFSIAESDLHTVIYLTLEQAMFGFSFQWTHLGDEKITLSRSSVTQPDEVVRLEKKGLVGDSRGDLFVRLALQLPSIDKGSTSLSLQAPASKKKVEPELFKEDEVELKEGGAWRRWRTREKSKAVGNKDKNSQKTEL